MSDAPCLEFGFDGNGCALLTFDNECVPKMHKFRIGKSDVCFNAYRAEKLDGLVEHNLLLNIHHCTTGAPHSAQQAAAHTKIKLRCFSELKILVTFKDTNAHVERRDPEGAGAACLHDARIALEQRDQQGQEVAPKA